MTDIERDDPSRSNGARVRFQAIVEAAGRGGDASDMDEAPTTPTTLNREAPLQAVALSGPRRNWNAASRQVWQATRLGAILIFFAIVFGWPLGAYWSHVDRFGGSSGWTETLLSTISAEIIMFAIFVPVLILLCGYLLSRAYTMLDAAESIASAAQQFIQPEKSAVHNVETVGIAVRGQMEALNTGVDGALQRLASVEAMIRQHVKAIETAGSAIETQTSGAVDRVAAERSRLIDLTENLNTQADAFAAAIAERAREGAALAANADDHASQAEARLEHRLSGLEQAATRALESFKALDAAIGAADAAIAERASTMEATANAAREASQTAAGAAKEAVESFAREAKTLGDAAVENTRTEAQRVKDETDKALQSVKDASHASIEAAAEDAAKAIAAAGNASSAAKEASDAASSASAAVENATTRIAASAADAKTAADAANADVERRSTALAEARAVLEQENARLEALIEEQRTRANKLAETIAQQTERLSKLAADQLSVQSALGAPAAPSPSPTPGPKPEPEPEPAQPQSDDKNILDLGRAIRRDTPPTPKRQAKDKPDAERLSKLAENISDDRAAPKSRAPKKNGAANSSDAAPDRKDKSDVSWKQILDAADDAEPLDLAAVSNPATEEKAPTRGPEIDAIRIIADLQGFTKDLETRLYGDPPSALLERFERGDRNVFANRILRLNEADVKRRIRMESGKDKRFETHIHQFLQGFENLLEDATTSETADEELEEYLSSPLGRVYLLIGATVGYFA